LLPSEVSGSSVFSSTTLSSNSYLPLSHLAGLGFAIMLSSIPTTLLALASVATAALVPIAEIQQRSFEYVIKPKVFIISLFRPEAEIWHGIPEFDILAMNITVPGFSVLVSAWEEW
jgi:hypothetical protein